MKKVDLKTLALAGMAGGLLLTGTAEGAGGFGSSKEAASMTAIRALRNQLNPEMQDLFDSLDEETKALAVRVANQTCAGMNECKGLNACKSETNSCAGQGSCKGQSGCAFTDKNLAVKLAHKHMQEKRAMMKE